MEITSTNEATLEMTDTPTGEGDTPAAATTEILNLLQTEMMAFKVTIGANWERQRTGCVAVVTGAAY